MKAQNGIDIFLLIATKGWNLLVIAQENQKSWYGEEKNKKRREKTKEKK
mgnify:CR=1 FL=1